MALHWSPHSNMFHKALLYKSKSHSSYPKNTRARICSAHTVSLMLNWPAHSLAYFNPALRSSPATGHDLLTDSIPFLFFSFFNEVLSLPIDTFAKKEDRAEWLTFVHTIELTQTDFNMNNFTSIRATKLFFYEINGRSNERSFHNRCYLLLHY